MTKEIIKVGVIGHVDYGKTTLTSAISSALASKGLQETKTIDEIIEEERGIQIMKSHPLIIGPVKDGKQNRRERRKGNQRWK